MLIYLGFIALLLLILALIVWIRKKLSGATIIPAPSDHDQSHVIVGDDYMFKLDPPPVYDRVTGVISGVNAKGDPVSFTKDEWCEKIKREIINLQAANKQAEAGEVLDNLDRLQKLLNLIC